MDVAVQAQKNAVADEVSALVAVVRPILIGLLYGLKGDVAAEVGGRENVKPRPPHGRLRCAVRFVAR
jgi:hypothetical protein